jgi:hypothetical protein
MAVERGAAIVPARAALGSRLFSKKFQKKGVAWAISGEFI